MGIISMATGNQAQRCSGASGSRGARLLRGRGWRELLGKETARRRQRQMLSETSLSNATQRSGTGSGEEGERQELE
jgi:hypothetical protein